MAPMAPNFKKWVGGIVLFFTGLSGLLGFFIYAIPNDSQRLTGIQCLVVIVFFVATISGALLYDAQRSRDAKLAYRWTKLGIDTWEDFPYNAALRQARVKSGWTERKLQEQAGFASYWKKERETTQIELEKLYERMGTPEQQRILKNKKIGHEDYLRIAIDNAHFYFTRYFRVWKLFETMGMLPIDPRTGEPWTNPEAFRKHMCIDKTQTEAPAVIVSLAEVTA